MTKMMCTSNTSRPATRFHTIVTARRNVAYPTMTNGYRLGFTLPPLPNPHTLPSADAWLTPHRPHRAFVNVRRRKHPLLYPRGAFPLVVPERRQWLSPP